MKLFSRILRRQIKHFSYFVYYKIHRTSFYKNYINQSKIKKISKALLSRTLGDSFDQVHTIFIETLTACNLRCSYCPNSVFDRGLIKNNQEMDLALFYNIINELNELNWVGEIQPHSYGEPLLDNRIVELCTYIKQKLPSSKINIFSNGELFNIDIYKKLVRAGVDIFSVTQHLEKEAAGTLEVIEYRKKNGDDHVILNYNKLKNINSRAGLIEVEASKQRMECNWPDHHVGISYDGEIMICCNDYLNEVKVGNVKNEKLIDIWQKPAYKKIRDNISSGDLSLNICENCTDGKVFDYSTKV